MRLYLVSSNNASHSKVLTNIFKITFFRRFKVNNVDVVTYFGTKSIFFRISFKKKMFLFISGQRTRNYIVY